ncbi:MAG: histone deacetylase family protein [Candidatus Geothermarchaeales archaeon]
MRTGVVYHEGYMEHNLGWDHPERPERLRRTMELLEGLLREPSLSLLKPEPCSEEDLLRVHTRGYVERIKAMSQRGGLLTMDTPLPRGTYETAKLAAGGAMMAGEAVVRGDLDNAFALTRPPGHHAGRSYGGGFCFFNNIAVMIEYLREEHRLKRFAVLDWDVHHGNGTQDIFYGDPCVLYLSTHQSPLYPGTGRTHEIGAGEGMGYNVNFPLSPGATGADFIHVLEELFLPLLEAFKPSILCLSTGYDAYFKDPLASLKFTIGTYGEATRLIKETAGRVCGGRIAAVLEGGYHLDAVSHGIIATVSTLASLDKVVEPHPPPRQELSEEVRGRVSDLKRTLSEHWDIF